MSTQPEALRLADALEQRNYPTEGSPECKAAAELRRLAMVEFAFDQWHEKTEWVQDTAQPRELGMHRADVLKQRIDRLHEVNQELLEVLQTIMGDGDHGQSMTWTERCQQARAAIAKATGEQA